jgi:YD repeat-containing protein
MKRFLGSSLIIVLVAISLASCKKDINEQAANPALTSDARASLRGTLNPNLALRLTKRGNDSLIYNADGSLAKVLKSPNQYITYEKSGNKLITKKYTGNTLQEKVQYVLDPSNGKAFTSEHTVYGFNLPKVTHWAYEYDNAGRLVKKFNNAVNAERYEFKWNPVINVLDWVHYYNMANEKVKSASFTYNDVQDKVKAWSDRVEVDSYLKIFGTSPSKLISWESVIYPNNPAANVAEHFEYTMNRSGYPMYYLISQGYNDEPYGKVSFSYSN